MNPILAELAKQVIPQLIDEILDNIERNPTRVGAILLTFMSDNPKAYRAIKTLLIVLGCDCCVKKLEDRLKQLQST